MENSQQLWNAKYYSSLPKASHAAGNHCRCLLGFKRISQCAAQVLLHQVTLVTSGTAIQEGNRAVDRKDRSETSVIHV